MSPVPTSPLPVITRAVYQVLHGDAELKAMVTGVFDYVPEDVAFDYVVIGEATEIPDNAHGMYGWQTTLTLHIWTRYRGYATALGVLARVVALLDHQPLALAGFHHVVTRYEWSQTLTDPAPPGDIRHVPVRFRIVTEQQE